MKLWEMLEILFITGGLSVVGNLIGTPRSLMETLPGMAVLITIAFVGMVCGRMLPGGIPGVAYVVTIGCIVTCPGVPGADMVNAWVKPVGFLQLCTPILAYAGVAICKDLDVFMESSWKIIIVSCFVFIGTYMASAVIAQSILVWMGQI